MTSKNRAIRYAQEHSECWEGFQALKDAHMDGALQQNIVDVERACAWLKVCLPDIEYITNASVYRQNKEGVINEFRKAMEGGKEE